MKHSMDKKDLFPIGIGTWGFGGFVEKDTSNDKNDIEAIKYSLSKGMNFIELNYWAAEGYAVELIAKAISESGVNRENLFLHQALYAYRNETIQDLKNELQTVLDILKTNYIDSIEVGVTEINEYGLEKVIDFLNDILKDGQVRYVSLMNSNLENLQRFKEEFGDKMFCHELNVNFEIRENEDLKITEFADNNDIINLIYQPLRRNRTAKRNWPLLVELSKKYDKTQNQIILNWLVSKGCLPLVKSSNVEHIEENLGALDFELDDSDIRRLNSFRPDGWVTPNIVWDNNSKEEGVFIHQLSNVFDDMYDMKR
ncbi:hypothetical protein BVX95_01940 [archaeon D22]|nr:hypothetical protein BVX95_01940 [archaeon D22]